MDETGRRSWSLSVATTLYRIIYTSATLQCSAVDEVHKYVYPREYIVVHTVHERHKTVCARIPGDTLNSNMISKARRKQDNLDIGDMSIRYALVGLAEVWSLIPSHPHVTRREGTLVYYPSVFQKSKGISESSNSFSHQRL